MKEKDGDVTMSHRHLFSCNLPMFPKDVATLFIVATIQFPPNSQKEIPDSLFHESGIC